MKLYRKLNGDALAQYSRASEGFSTEGEVEEGKGGVVMREVNRSEMVKWNEFKGWTGRNVDFTCLKRGHVASSYTLCCECQDVFPTAPPFRSRDTAKQPAGRMRKACFKLNMIDGNPTTTTNPPKTMEEHHCPVFSAHNLAIPSLLPLPDRCREAGQLITGLI